MALFIQGFYSSYAAIFFLVLNLLRLFKPVLRAAGDLGEHGVFGSQAILLILRRLARAGAIQLNPEPLERTHSRGCSPNALYALLA